MTRPLIFLLVGTTSSGKHRIAMELAPLLGAEILSLDSMKIYRGMDIGTAKPSDEARCRIPHHLLDLVEPYESFSVGDYLSRALPAVEEILERGCTPLFVGGTGLYLHALTEGLFEGPKCDHDLRRRIRGEGTPAELHQRLAQVDPLRAEQIHPNDLRRTIRALEIFECTGVPMSVLLSQAHHQALEYPHRIVYLKRDPADTTHRIDERTAGLFRQGLIEEVQRLHENPDRLPGPQAQRAVGYPEVLAHLAGTTSLNECIEAVKSSTRRLARRQRTWFRNWPDGEVAHLHANNSPRETAEDLVRRFEGPRAADQ